MSSKVPTPSADSDANMTPRQPEQGGSPRGTPPAIIPKAGEGTFRKGYVIWGRPPQVTFRAGPLPRDEGLARLMAMPPHPRPSGPRVTGSSAAGGGSARSGLGQSGSPLSGSSNVPRAAAPGGAGKPAASGSIFGNSLVPPAARPKPQPEVAEAGDVTPPAAVTNVSDAGTTPAAVATAGATTAPVEPETTIHELPPVVARRSAETVEVAPVAASRSAGKRSLGPWIAIGAIVLAGGAAALWWDSRDKSPEVAAPIDAAPEGPVTAPAEIETPAAEGSAADQVVSPSPEPVAPAASQAASSAPVATPARAPVSPPAPGPASARAQRPAPAQTAPARQAAPASTPAPVVVVAPPAETAPVVEGPPPTAARPAQTDPDAPVVTRPTPLD